MLPKFLRPLASIGLTVVLLVVIAIAMVYGTLYESSAGTSLAQADVYHSVWFDFLLGLLAINLVACTLNRYPFKPHQAGWLLTHVGILIILAGAVISRHWGMEGQMTIYEGQTLNRIEQSGKQLEAAFNDGTQAVLPLNLESLPRAEGGTPEVVTLPNNRGKLTLIRYLPSAHNHQRMVPSPEGVPAAHMKLDAPMSSMDEWLWSGSSETAHWEIPMVGVVMFIAWNTENVDTLKAFHSGEYLVVATPGNLYLRSNQPDASFTPIAVGQKVPLSSATALTVLERKDNVLMMDEYEPAPGGKGNPALQFSVTSANGKLEGPYWIGYGMQVGLDEIGLVLRLMPKLQSLDFKITLKQFRRTFYPGTEQAASYESDIMVTDPEKGSFPVNIAMNNPMVHRGWKFFQSSFFNENGRDYSVFSVSYDPGTTTVYGGSIVLVLGLIGIIFLKGPLKQRYGQPTKQNGKE